MAIEGSHAIKSASRRYPRLWRVSSAERDILAPSQLGCRPLERIHKMMVAKLTRRGQVVRLSAVAVHAGTEDNERIGSATTSIPRELRSPTQKYIYLLRRPKSIYVCFVRILLNF